MNKLPFLKSTAFWLAIGNAILIAFMTFGIDLPVDPEAVVTAVQNKDWIGLGVIVYNVIIFLVDFFKSKQQDEAVERAVANTMQIAQHQTAAVSSLQIKQAVKEAIQEAQ